MCIRDRDPPGEPSRRYGLLSLKIIVGDIELRGLFPPSTRFAINLPFFSGRKEKSVISLFSKNHPAVSRLPNPVSIVDVREIALPRLSTIEKCVVPLPSFCLCNPLNSFSAPGGNPGPALFMGTELIF